jgi:hypothetical protein
MAAYPPQVRLGFWDASKRQNPGPGRMPYNVYTINEPAQLPYDAYAYENYNPLNAPFPKAEAGCKFPDLCDTTCAPMTYCPRSVCPPTYEHVGNGLCASINNINDVVRAVKM